MTYDGSAWVETGEGRPPVEHYPYRCGDDSWCPQRQCECPCHDPAEAAEAEEREARDLATAPSLTPSDGAWEAATEAWRARWAELRNRRRST